MSPRPAHGVASALVAVGLAVAGPARAGEPPRGRAVITALAVEGELEPAWRLEFEQRLRAGLERGDAVLVEPRAPVDCRDATCWRAVSESADAEHVIVSRLAVAGRDYEIRIDVRSRRDGEVVAHVEQRCELCGLGEAAERLSDVAAAIAVDLDTLAAVGARQTVRLPRVEAPRDRPHLRRFTPAALALGAAGIIAGTSLVAIDERPIRSRCTGENVNPLGICKYRHDTLAGGAVLLASGVAMAITGVVLAVVLRKAKRRPRSAR